MEEKMSSKSQKSKRIKREEKALLTFLQRTKEGKYVPVEMKLIESARTIQEYGMISHSDQEYYYSLS